VKQTLVCLLAACTLATAACSTSSDPSTSSLPTAPTTPLVTENFSGTVQVLGSDAHTFTVTSANAPITLTLTSAGPPPTITMGFGIGTWDATTSTCTFVSSGFVQTQAGPTYSATIASGLFCLMVSDIGNLSAPIIYTAVVTHF
jgi:hypothetical protein